MPATELTLPARPIKPTRGGRLLDYANQLFPPAVYIPSGIASFLAIHLALQAMSGSGPLQLGWRVAIGAVSVVLFTLILRVNDELKDVESDRQLALEGDPRYAGRALVTGHVKLEDLVALRRAAVFTVVVLNLATASAWALAGFALTMAVLWLSARWFFWPKIQQHLLLAFATHNPIAAVVALYVVSIFIADHGLAALPGATIFSVLAAWLPLAAWETARKVRIPADETRYQTYSKIFGWKAAPLLPVLFATLSTLCLLPVIREARLPSAFLAITIAANAVVALASLVFRLYPTRKTANLRPWSEVYVVTVTMGLAVALMLTHGVRW